MSWIRDRLNLVDKRSGPAKPTPMEDFQMALRVEEALAKTAEATATARRHAEEAQRLFGTIRREIHNTQLTGEG